MLTFTVELSGEFFQDLGGCWKHKLLGKKGNLSTEKNKLTNFSCIIKYDKPQGTFYKGPQGILAITVEVIGSILYDLRYREKKTFQKKAVFTMTKVLANFLSYYRVWQTSENNL